MEITQANLSSLQPIQGEHLDLINQTIEHENSLTFVPGLTKNYQVFRLVSKLRPTQRKSYAKDARYG